MSWLQWASQLSVPAQVGLAVAVVVVYLVVRRLIFGGGGGGGGGDHGGKNRPVLSREEYRQFPLVEKRIITHNTRVFRFGLPRRDDVLGLPIGQHISFSIQKTNEAGQQVQVMRSYTPISSDDDRGHFDVLIKVYPGGAMSEHLDRMAIGDRLNVRGPKGLFLYRPNMKRAIGMLAGGTGITPMYQIAQAILKNGADATRVSMLFGNLTVDDILLRDELAATQAKHADRFSCYHVLNSAPAGWDQGVGFITADIIKARCPPPADDTLVLCCGPPPMLAAMEKHLVALGYTKFENGAGNYFLF